jgi:hypothetical protein
MIADGAWRLGQDKAWRRRLKRSLGRRRTGRIGAARTHGMVEAGDGAARRMPHTTAAGAMTRRPNPIKSGFESGWLTRDRMLTRMRSRAPRSSAALTARRFNIPYRGTQLGSYVATMSTDRYRNLREGH